MSKTTKILKYFFLAGIFFVLFSFLDTPQAKAVNGYLLKGKCSGTISGKNKPSSTSMEIPFRYSVVQHTTPSGPFDGSVFSDPVNCVATYNPSTGSFSGTIDQSFLTTPWAVGFTYTDATLDSTFYIDKDGNLYDSGDTNVLNTPGTEMYTGQQKKLADRTGETQVQDPLGGTWVVYSVFDFGGLTSSYAGTATVKEATITGEITWEPGDREFYKKWKESHGEETDIRDAVGIYLFTRYGDHGDWRRVVTNSWTSSLNAKTNKITYTLDKALVTEKNNYKVIAYFIIGKDGDHSNEYKGDLFPAVWTEGWWSSNQFLGYTHDDYLGQSNPFPGKPTAQGFIHPAPFKLVFLTQKTTGSSIEDIMKGVLELVNKALTAIINFIMAKLDGLLIIGNFQKNTAILKTWQMVRDAGNILLIIGLLIIALANAVRAQMDYYTAKALIPRLIIAAIFINFSLLLVQLIMDLGNVLVAYFLYSGTNKLTFQNIIPVNQLDGILATGGAVGIAMGTIALFLFKGFVLVIILVAVVTVLAVLVLRVALLWFLAILSPIIFLFAVLPFTRGLTSTWWNYFVRYVFMGAMVALILNIAVNISSAPLSKVAADQFIRLILTIALVFMAGLIPILLGDKLASAVSGKIGDWTKGVKKSRFARSRGGASLIARRKQKEIETQNRAYERYAGGNILTRPLSGTRLGKALGVPDEAERRAVMARVAKGYDFSHLAKEEKYDYLRNHDPMKDARALAMARELSKAGLVNDDRLSEYTHVDDRIGQLIAHGDSDIISNTKSSQPYLFLNRYSRGYLGNGRWLQGDRRQRAENRAYGLARAGVRGQPVDQFNGLERHTMDEFVQADNQLITTYARNNRVGRPDAIRRNAHRLMSTQMGVDSMRNILYKGSDKARNQFLDLWHGTEANNAAFHEIMEEANPEAYTELRNYIEKHPYTGVGPEAGPQGEENRGPRTPRAPTGVR